jgi:hypothetical protein
MTGSRRWFQYEADNGKKYAVELDESTYETNALGFEAIDASATVGEGRVLQASAKRPLRMRYVMLYRKVGGDIKRRKVYCGKKGVDVFTGQAQSVEIDGGVAWSILSTIGERRKGVPQKDTAQLDGDEDNNFGLVQLP